jgi:hypothetical protein
VSADSLAQVYIDGKDVVMALMQGGCVWISNYPAGLKLNSELVGFLGELFVWLIKFWDRAYFRN